MAENHKTAGMRLSNKIPMSGSRWIENNNKCLQVVSPAYVHFSWPVIIIKENKYCMLWQSLHEVVTPSIHCTPFFFYSRNKTLAFYITETTAIRWRFRRLQVYWKTQEKTLSAIFFSPKNFALSCLGQIPKEWVF